MAVRCVVAEVSHGRDIRCQRAGTDGGHQSQQQCAPQRRRAAVEQFLQGLHLSGELCYGFRQTGPELLRTASGEAESHAGQIPYGVAAYDEQRRPRHAVALGQLFVLSDLQNPHRDIPAAESFDGLLRQLLDGDAGCTAFLAVEVEHLHLSRRLRLSARRSGVDAWLRPLPPQATSSSVNKVRRRRIMLRAVF